MTRTRWFGLLAALCCATPAARGATLFERQLLVDRSANIFTTDEFGLKFVFASTILAPPDPVTLFGNLAITPADVGQEFEVNATNDPTFAEVAARMTDGADKHVRLAFTELASGRAEQRGWSESGFFLGRPSTQVPDLAGYQINAVKLRIDDFVLFPDAVGGAANAAAAPPVQLKFTISVQGVPEPSSLGMTGGALLALSVAAYTVAKRRRATEHALRLGLCPAAARSSRVPSRG